MKVSFELSPRDIAYFRSQLKTVRNSLGDHDEDEIVEGAKRLMDEAREAQPPEFVVVRLGKLEQLVAMLEDAEWRLEGRDRAHILDALAYFVDPEDMIPDRLPAIGYLDDAIMVELIAQELKHEIQAYVDFCAFRKTRPARDDLDKLEARRKALQARMRRRSRSERQRMRERRSSRSPLRLW